MSVVIKSLSKSYTNKVLDNVNIHFRKGEISGVVGENGAGKTTLFKCIAGLEDYDGSVEYDNGLLKNKVGFLSTNPYFISKITGKEYLQLMCNARNIKIDEFEEKNIFDLPLSQYAETYSTGMKKKLAITGLLLLDNEVFILDEPFNGVDINSNILIKEIIFRLKELDKTIIISSHIFSTLKETCDNLHHLKNGVIVSSVDKGQFDKIENDMKNVSIKRKIDLLIPN